MLYKVASTSDKNLNRLLHKWVLMTNHAVKIVHLWRTQKLTIMEEKWP